MQQNFQTTYDKSRPDNESMVSSVSKRYMRVIIGTARLVVCLSEYLRLRSVYRISSMSMILV